MRLIFKFTLVLFLAAAIRPASAFSLLGPFTPGMTAQLSYQDGASIGGPMNIGEGYRWNTPVITYAFDNSFLNYFGPKGVAAVESAIQILNDLPTASALDLSSYPINVERMNYQAQAQNLADLKSTVLSLLLEQMGLASPSRFTFSLQNFSYANQVTNYTVIQRNFNPFTLTPTNVVDDTFYSGLLYVNGVPFQFYVSHPELGLVRTADIEEFVIDPLQPAYPAVADDRLSPGQFFIGLSQDDVGGLRYLLSSNNIAMESLLPDVHGTGSNTVNYVNRAPRPGVEKITFQRLDFDSILSQTFLPFTNQYTDLYISNGVIQQQMVERVVTQPDILFSMRDLGVFAFSRTGTTNWANNGLAGSAGPGVIQPHITIAFNNLGRSLYRASPGYSVPGGDTIFPMWGSFDNSTNAPTIYPPGFGSGSATFISFNLFPAPEFEPTFSQQPTVFSWQISGAPGALFSLQTSTDAHDWATFATITNTGGIFTYADFVWTNTPQRFFRTIPQ